MSMHHPDALRQWLSLPEAQHLLTRLARQIVRDSERQSIRVDFFQQANDTSTKIQEVRSELAMFLLAHDSGIARYPEPNSPTFTIYLKTAFLNHLKDLARQKNPGKRRYRQIVNIIKESPQFITAANSAGTFFGQSPATHKIHLTLPDDVAHIPYPAHIPYIGSVANLVKKPHLLALAAYFREQIAASWHDDLVLIPIRGFIAWIGRFVDLSDQADILYLAPTPGADFDPTQIHHWAEAFARQLTTTEKDAFYLRYGTALKLREIAASLGYGSPSGVNYPLQCAYNKLRDFLPELPGLDPDDINEEAFSCFFENLLANLKNSSLSP